MKRKTVTVIVVLILLLGYPFWRIHNAKISINQFSQQISVGTSIETVELLSQKLNLNIIKSAGNDSTSITLVVWDGWAFARWTCLVLFENNKVVSKKVSFID
jgi:hypothetical protein